MDYIELSEKEYINFCKWENTQQKQLLKFMLGEKEMMCIGCHNIHISLTNSKHICTKEEYEHYEKLGAFDESYNY